MKKNNDEYMTLRQGAAYLGITYGQFYCWRYNHSINTYRRGVNSRTRGRPLVYVKRSDLDALKALESTFVEVQNKGATNESEG